MTINGIGTDIVSIKRMKNARHRERVAEYVLCDNERKLLDASADPVEYLASRLAAKEAVVKAFPGTLNLQDISIVKDGNKLKVEFKDSSMGASYAVFVSISHEFEYALGFAVVCSI